MTRSGSARDTLYYSGVFVYNNAKLDYALTGEGRVVYTNGLFSYEYFLKDHIGSTRVATAANGTVNTSTFYYPFGLALKEVNSQGDNRYLFGGKELQDDMIGGVQLGVYDFNFRTYDPQLGRFWQLDPLAERRIEWSSYAYCLNNPILRFDPNGLTDFTFNKKTGEVKQVGEINNDPDRILKTKRFGRHKGEVKYNRKGEAKVAVDGLEKGILKDGQNFKTDDQVINVGGEGQPTLAGVEDFVTKMGEYVGVEIAGAYLSTGKGENAPISKVYIDEYQGNESQKSSISLSKLAVLPSGSTVDPSLQGFNSITFFHTHPSNIGISRTDVERPSGITGSGGDLGFRDKFRNQFCNFLILTRTATYPTTVQRIPYTKWER